MGLDFAIDELYATGWSADEACQRSERGRLYPGIERVRDQFQGAGFAFAIEHVQLFECYRASWRTPSGETRGAVVGQSPEEAAVYALSQLRRSLAAASA